MKYKLPILFSKYFIYVFLIIFILTKVNVLWIPYFWDELGVYIPGMRNIVEEHTIGIMPKDLIPLYSRGHPMLFYFLGANIMRFLGDSVLIMHSLAIFIACVTLYFFYNLSKILFSNTIAMLAVVIVAFQPVFFTMSGVMLPEMMLTLFIFMSLYAIILNHWNLYVSASILAIMTKETAIIIPATALLILFIDSIQLKDFFTFKRWRLFIVATAPLIAFGIFLCIQKYQNGWYFFPEHIGYIDFNMNNILSNCKPILYQIGFGQGRYFLFLILIISLIFCFKSFFTKSISRIVLVFLLFTFISTVFSSINYFLPRYQLYIFPIFVLVSVYGFHCLVVKYFLKFELVSIVFFLSISILLSFKNMKSNTFNDTYDMSYLHTVQSVQKAIQLFQQEPYKDSLLRTSFPINKAIENNKNGYVYHKFNIDSNFYDYAPNFISFSIDRGEFYNPWKYDSIIKELDYDYIHIQFMTYKK